MPQCVPLIKKKAKDKQLNSSNVQIKIAMRDFKFELFASVVLSAKNLI